MNRAKAILLGFLSVLPLIFMLSFLVAVSKQVFGSSTGLPKFAFTFGSYVFLGTLILVGYYVFHLFKKSSVSQEDKPQWALLLFFCHFGAIPFYWYFHIWKTSRPSMTA